MFSAAKQSHTVHFWPRQADVYAFPQAPPTCMDPPFTLAGI